MGKTARKPTQTLPLQTYRLAEALAEFRYRVEQAYAWAASSSDPETGDPDSVPNEPIPTVVEQTRKTILRLTNSIATVIGNRTGFDKVAAAVWEAAADAQQRLGRCWHRRPHRDLIRNRRRQERENAGEVDRVRLFIEMLAASPVGPNSWAAYELAVRTFECGLPGDYQPLFSLGRLLGRVVFAPYEDHVTAKDNNHWDRSARLLIPAVKATLSWATASVPHLGQLNVAWTGDEVEALYQLRREVVGVLGKTADVGLAAPPVGSIESAEYRRLLGIKTKLIAPPTAKQTASSNGLTPPEGDYVGESVAVLKVFEQIAICQKAGFRAVLLLGPKGTGKTTLAGIIHRALTGEVSENETAFPQSTGKKSDENTGGRLLRWQASHSQASDPLGPRSHWIGFAANSGYQNVPVEGKPGLLKECSGGSIFIDEFGDLHPDVQTLLLDVAEGRDVIPVGGTLKDAYRPNVYLILATNKDVQAAIRDDLLDRIPMQIRLPPLRDRPEDIFPLVRHSLRETQFTLSIRTWTLFIAHDWPGNVRELEHTLERVRAANEVKAKGRRRTSRQKLVELPHELFLKESEGLRKTAERVGDASGDDVAEYRLFNILKATLETRGYQAAARGRTGKPLYARMGELLGMDRTKVSRMKQRVERFESRSPLS